MGAGFDFRRIDLFPKGASKIGGAPGASIADDRAPQGEPEEEQVVKSGGDRGETALRHEMAHLVNTGGAQALSAAGSAPKPLICGGYKWRVDWALSQPSPKGGWVVQEYDEVKASTKCDGKNDSACNNQGGMKGGKITYWEAWKVAPGQSVPSPSGDNYDDPGCGSGTQGTDAITGTARFYEGLTLPAHFKPNNPATFAGSLPSTTTDPKLTGGTSPFLHTLQVKWNCCPDKKKKSTVVGHKP